MSETENQQWAECLTILGESRGVRFFPAFVDITGDVVSALLLSQIVYWHTPAANGITRLRIERDGHMWLAKTNDEWWNECRLERRQVRRAMDTLIERDIIEAHLWRLFGGPPVWHVRIIPDTLYTALVGR